MKLIGCLVLDIGGRCILALSKELNCSRKFIRKSRDFVINNCQMQLSIEFRGRKSLTVIYPELKKDIINIIDNNLSVDPRFKFNK